MKLVVLFVVAAAALCGACGPQGYYFADSETFVRGKGVGKKYKTAAILYFGYAEASTKVASDQAEAADAETSDSRVGAYDFVSFSNALIDALARAGMNVVERNRVNELVREQGLVAEQLVDLSDLDKVRRLGKLLKADLLIKGSVFNPRGGFRTTDDGDVYHVMLIGLTVRAVDANTGQIVWSDVTTVAIRTTPEELDDKEFVSNYTVVRAVIAAMVKRFLG